MENRDFQKSYDIDSEQLSFKDILEKILRAKWWIINASLLSLIITIYITFSTPPVYQAKTSVIIETSNRAKKIFNYNLNNDVKISDEIALIKSRVVAEEVVKRLWKSNKRNYLYLFGTKTFMPRGQRIRRPIKKFLTLGKWSPEASRPPQYGGGFSPEIAQRYYRSVINSLNVYYSRGTNIINIIVSSPHPEEAAIIANTVAKVYQEKDREWNTNESASLKSFLSQRLNDKEIEIANVGKKLEEFKRENKIYDIKGNLSNLLNNLTSIETEYNSNIIAINLMESQKDYLSKQLSGLEKDLVNQMLSSINAQLNVLRLQINDKEGELLKNETVYGSNHEAVIKTKNQLLKLKKQLETMTNDMVSEGLSIVDPLEYRQEIISKLLNYETQLHQLNAKSKQYKLLIEKYRTEIESLPEKQSYLADLEREKNVLNDTYSFIRQKMEEARVSMASEPGKVRIINEAEEPSNPISPDMARNIIMGIILGALTGLGVKIVIEYFDDTIRSTEIIERANLPILAIIPSISSKKDFNKPIYSKENFNKGNIERRLITHEDPISPISEAYRGLRTSLMYTKKGSNGVVMVSSPGPGEGKTTTIINLAITYANLGKKTILIDGDLRKPVIHKVFDIDKKRGLTHYLSGVEENIENIINHSGINNLDIIYNGAIPPNPSELLGSELMIKLVQSLKQKYDVILFDAPPILAVTDSVVLSRFTDQFILVVRFGVTEKKSIGLALNSLKNVKSSITGVIFNDLNQKNSYYTKNYYAYQEYYTSPSDS